MTQTYIGVDLSKDWLDIYDPRSGHARLANTTSAIRLWFGTLDTTCLVVFEATSGCDEPLRRVASDLQQPVHRVNPLHSWHFAQSLNLPKTDRIDARMLARMGAERRLSADVTFDTVRAELAELLGRREQLKRMETQEKHRLAKATSPTVRTDIRSQLRLFANRIARIERAIERFLSQHPALSRPVALLQTIPSIGRITALTLLAKMPELGTLDRRQVASLGGLAPKARESGKWRGQRALGDGRRQVRKALYMAAISAISHNRLCPGLLARMREKNKPGKVIVIAIARKLLTIANAVLRDNLPYRTHN